MQNSLDPLDKKAAYPWKATIAAALLGTLFLFLLARLDVQRQQLSENLMFIPDSYQTPVKAISPPRPPFLGGVLLLHGYGGSKETMQTLARDLALEGFYTFSLDLPGCGDSQSSFTRKNLLPAVNSAYENLMARALLTPGRVAVVGHSMGGGLALQFAREHPGVQATILLSSVPGEVGPDTPRNLLLLTAEDDLPGLKQAAARMLQASFPGKFVRAGATLGEFASGTARRAVEAQGANHLTILYSRRASRESRAWLKQALKIGSPVMDIPSRSLVVTLLLLAALLLFLPLVTVAVYFATPDEESFELGAVRPKQGWLILAAACIAGGMASAFLPSRPWIPIHMVDYVSTAYALAGVAVTAAGYWLGMRVSWGLPPWRRLTRPLLLALGGFLFIYWNIGLAVNDQWLRMSLSGGRWEVAARVALLLAPMIVVQELVSRNLQQRHGVWRSYRVSVLMNALLLIGLLLPALLRLGSVDAFLLIISSPFLAAFLLLIPLLSAWLFRASSSLLLCALWTILVYAWLFTATPYWK